MSAFADYWKRIGSEVEERGAGPVRAQPGVSSAVPGLEARSSGGGDGILRRFEAPAAKPENRCVGNRDDYEDPGACGTWICRTRAGHSAYWSSHSWTFQNVSASGAPGAGPRSS